MENQIVNQWAKFSLSEDESAEININVSQSNSETSKRQIDLMLVGKVYTSKNFNAPALRSTLQQVWALREGVTIREVGKSNLVFQFYNRGDKEKVLRGRPWNFDNFLIFLQEIDAETNPGEVVFSHSPFWIRVLDIPLKYRTLEIAKQIGNAIGTYMEADFEESPLWADYLKIWVNIDVTKPLRRGIKLRVNETELVWVGFQYERLPSFCYKCGKIGHSMRECKMEIELENSESLPYGPWMRAPSKQKGYVSFEERKRDKNMLDNFLQKQNIEENWRIAGDSLAPRKENEKEQNVNDSQRNLGKIELRSINQCEKDANGVTVSITTSTNLDDARDIAASKNMGNNNKPTHRTWKRLARKPKDQQGIDIMTKRSREGEEEEMEDDRTKRQKSNEMEIEYVSSLSDKTAVVGDDQHCGKP